MQRSFLNAALASVVLALTLVVGVSGPAYAQQQPSQPPSPSSVTDVSPTPDVSPNSSQSSGPSSEPPTRVVIQAPYTPPSMGGDAIPSNHRGSHGD